MRLSTVLIFACVCLSVAGCFQRRSCNIPTEKMICSFLVEEQDGHATATAWFSLYPEIPWFLGPLTPILTIAPVPVALGCGDDIAVNGITMPETRPGWPIEYKAPLDAAESYTFVFTREGEPPYTSTVAAPPSLVITAPSPGTTISRRSAFDIAWEDNGNDEENVSLTISGCCIEPLYDSASDNGLLTVDARELTGLGFCEATLTILRIVEGAMDPALMGNIEATSTGETWITSTF